MKPTKIILLDSRLAAYAAVVGAALAGPAISTCEADIIYSGPVNIPVTNSIDGIYFNLITGVTGSSAATVPGWDINPYNNGAGFTLYGAASPSGIVATGTPGTTAEATRLVFGDLISSALQFNQFQTRGTAFQSGGTGYAGIRFLNETTGVQNYGWVQFSTSAGSGTNVGFPASIIAYGYQNNGGSITAGQVPEPSTVALLGMVAVGAAGVREWRRRKAA